MDEELIDKLRKAAESGLVGPLYAVHARDQGQRRATCKSSGVGVIHLAHIDSPRHHAVMAAHAPRVLHMCR